MNKFVEMLATFFYVGKIPFAPGTFGTLAAIPLWFALSKLNPIWYMAIAFLIVIFGIFISQMYEKTKSEHDSKEIVIDEVAGFLITMVWLPPTWQSVVLALYFFGFSILLSRRRSDRSIKKFKVVWASWPMMLLLEL